jgi:hypothetical protein
MRPVISFLSRGFLLAAFAATGTLAPAPAHQTPAVSPVISLPSQDASTNFTTEVRLRKLHLVRPDLIPYPIETEIYC